MPHITLEYSNNITEKTQLKKLFQALQLILVETLPTKMSACTSRAIECNIFQVGDDEPNAAFVHVNIKVLSGRSAQVLQQTGEKILNAMSEFFEQSLGELTLRLSTEISELQPTYFKRA